MSDSDFAGQKAKEIGRVDPGSPVRAGSYPPPALLVREVVQRAHKTAIMKGWWEKESSPVEKLMMVVTELAECVEDLRAEVRKPEAYQLQASDLEGISTVLPSSPAWDANVKPLGYGIELADAVIRIADLCGNLNIDLDECIRVKMEYNERRSYRHGNKRY